MPEFKVFQYAVEFKPILKSPHDKKHLLKQHRRTFGEFILDGATVYTTNELTELTFTSYLASDNKITFNFTQVQITWPSFHLLNLIFQKSIGELDLQMIGDNFYDNSTVARNQTLAVDKLY